jgi:hypothetical protein
MLRYIFQSETIIKSNSKTNEFFNKVKIQKTISNISKLKDILII